MTAFAASYERNEHRGGTLAGKLTWLQAADIRGRTPPASGACAGSSNAMAMTLVRSPPPDTVAQARAPVAEIQRLLALYRDCYQGSTSATSINPPAGTRRAFLLGFVKQALQAAGLVAKHQPRGAIASAAPPPLLRRTAPPRWQSAPVTRLGARPLAHHDRHRSTLWRSTLQSPKGADDLARSTGAWACAHCHARQC